MKEPPDELFEFRSQVGAVWKLVLGVEDSECRLIHEWVSCVAEGVHDAP